MSCRACDGLQSKACVFPKLHICEVGYDDVVFSQISGSSLLEMESSSLTGGASPDILSACS